MKSPPITVRLTAEQRAALEEAAKEAGLTPGEALRRGAELFVIAHKPATSRRGVRLDRAA